MIICVPPPPRQAQLDWSAIVKSGIVEMLDCEEEETCERSNVDCEVVSIVMMDSKVIDGVIA